MTTTITTAPPAALVRMQPTQGQETDCAHTLSGVRLSRYWPHLADTLTAAIGDIHDAHGTECRRRICRTCTAIAAALAWIDAHHTLNTTGCPCVIANHDHTAIPHPTRGFQP